MSTLTTGTNVERNGGETPEDLVRLAEQLGSPPARIDALGAPDSPRAIPGVFRVCLANGRRLKARVMLNRAHAERMEFILSRLCHPAFPRVVARRGSVVMLEWVDGEPVGTSAPTPAILRTCGMLQAFIHTTALPEPCRYRPADPLGNVGDNLRSDVDALVAGEVLDSKEGCSVLDLGMRFAPIRAEVGFVHRDLCPANIVIRPCGEISVIDNETLSVGALDFDLARTWYRWPMTASEREHYLGAYAKRRELGEFVRHFPFWAVAVLADSIRLRLGAAAAVRSVPLDRLKTLLATVDRGAVTERLAFES